MISATGRLTIQQHDCALKSQSPVRRRIVAIQMPDNPKDTTPEAFADAIALTDGFIAVLKRGDTVRAVRKQGEGEHAVAADVGEHQDVVLSLEGPASHGEDNVGRVAGVLVQRLRSSGRSWSEPRIVAGLGARAESGIDFEIDGADGSIVLAQVTRADTNRELWACLADVGQIQGRYGLNKTAGALRDAIEKKARIPEGDRRVMSLVLDATLVAGHAMPPVIEEFRRQHGEWARGIGFQAIWCVGPVQELVWRLDET